MFTNKKLEKIQLDNTIADENTDEKNCIDKIEMEDFIDDPIEPTAKRRKRNDTRTKWTKEGEEEIRITFKHYFEKK
ncbi:hypothetical protein SNE40_019934 [Patella caerulea]|uniref:Uncharacterized protein n=1 Tax=Patella caerulea TaxID=87958 RepID=A0AAN8IZQ9_PATCE